MTTNEDSRTITSGHNKKNKSEPIEFYDDGTNDHSGKK